LSNNVELFYQNTANYDLTPETASVDTTVMKRARVEAAPDSGSTSHWQGDTVYFNHILKNIGNASDTFYFDSASIQGWKIEIIDDDNQDGTRQSSETSVLSVTSPILKNDTHSFFVSVFIPGNAADSAKDTVTVNVISGYKYPDTFIITDTITVDSPPSMPTGLSAIYGGTYVGLIWNANAETDVIGYNVYKSTNGGGYEKINSSIVNDTSFNDTGLVYPNNYCYKIKVADAIQESAFSDSASAPYLAITKAADITDTQPGGYVNYTISLNNTGYAPATRVVVFDTLPAYTIFDTATVNNAADTILYSDSGTEWYDTTDTVTVNYVKWQSGIDLNSGDTAEYGLKVRIKW